MKDKPTTYRFTRSTLDQIEAIAAHTGHSKANAIATAIDRMYREEIKAMTEQEQTVPAYKPTKKSIAAVQRWWKAGKNIWEISQLTGLSESEVTYIAREYT